jgi:tetratricopeptide (TPR) repeat protein
MRKLLYTQNYTLNFTLILAAAVIFSLTVSSCDYVTHRTMSKDFVSGTEEPDPDYDIALDYNYQDFTSFIFMGNRSESFGTYFNKLFSANEDFDDALKEYRASTIATYNRRLDSLNITPPVLQSTKDKFTKVIERCSKIIQYNKNTKYFDDAVLLVGLSYFYSVDYLQAERKFNEFLSKLTKSDLSDEALLYLGKTKFKLGKNNEGEAILKNLLNTTKKDEIKAEIFQELAIYNLSLKNFSEADTLFNNSINLTKDKETKAERQFVLAKLYSTGNPEKAPIEYEKVFKNTTNFDLEFYAKLNEAKSLARLNKHNESMEILNKLRKKYIDYPDFEQLVELEIANKDFASHDYKDARLKYFDIIVKYSSGKAVAESYYQLGVYYEKIKKDYLKSLVSYKKAIELSTSLDYYNETKKKTDVLDSYFKNLAVIHDTTKIEIPAEEPDLDKYKKDYLEKENKGLRKENSDPVKGGTQPKGGGYSGRDSVPESKDTSVVIKETKDSLLLPKDTSVVLNKEFKDSLHLPKDTSLVQKKEGQDTIKAPVVNEDSLRAVKESGKMNAYFELAEMFYYDLDHADSSIFYLNKIIENYKNPDWLSKAEFYLGTIYKSQGDNAKASEYFNRVIKDYPNTLYANESRKLLGLPTVEQSYDAADSLVTQAGKLYISGNPGNMISLLTEAITKYPESPLVPKAIYSLGWVYENVYPNKDSALKYYTRLKTEFPASEYALSVSSTLAFFDELKKKNDDAVKDSLAARDSLKKNISDTTKLQTDSLKTLPDSTGILNPEIKSDSTSVNPEQNNLPKDPSGESKNSGENKTGNDEMLNPKEKTPPPKK